jgi:hypothetical protein
MAEECTDETELAALTGGGSYEVQAKNERGELLKRGKAFYEFPGPPKEWLLRRGGAEDAAAVPVAAAPAAPAPERARSGNGIDMTQIIVAMMNNQQATLVALISALPTMVGGGAKSDSVALVKALLDAKGGAGGGGGLKVEDVFKLLSKGAEIAADKIGEDDGGEGQLQSLAGLLGSVTKLAEIGKEPAPNVPGAVTG